MPDTFLILGGLAVGLWTLIVLLMYEDGPRKPRTLKRKRT